MNKNDIAYFIENTDFDGKLININKKLLQININKKLLQININKKLLQIKQST